MNSLKQAEQLWDKICFDPKYKPKGRYQTYRELITWGLEDAVRGVCPVARSILSESEWHQVFLYYLKSAPPQSQILRDVAYEFADFLQTHRHPLQKKYPYLGELVEYEVLEIRMRFFAEDSSPTPRGKLRLNPAHALGRYRWPVHFIREEFSDAKQMPRSEYHLLLWREPVGLEVKFMEVNPLVASLIRELERGPASPKTMLRKIAKIHRISSSGEFLSEGQALLRDLEEKQILFS